MSVFLFLSTDTSPHFRAKLAGPDQPGGPGRRCGDWPLDSNDWSPGIRPGKTSGSSVMLDHVYHGLPVGHNEAFFMTIEWPFKLVI